jgi:hypothetical protein
MRQRVGSLGRSLRWLRVFGGEHAVDLLGGYDVETDERTVKIKAIGCKDHNSLRFRGKEWTL